MMNIGYAECLFSNSADYTAKSGFTSEASILGGVNEQPWLYAGFFDQQNRAAGKAVRLIARGVLGTTGTPTYLFTVRLGATGGSASLTGTQLAASAAITTSSGVSTKWWEVVLDVICNAPGIGSGNTTLSCNGTVRSPGGFASPFEYAMTQAGGESGTWTTTIDNSVIQYFNLSVTCSANSGSNTLTCKELLLLGWN